MGTKFNVRRRGAFCLLSVFGWLLAMPALASSTEPTGDDLPFVDIIFNLQKSALVVLAIIAVLGLVAALVKWAASQSNMEVASFGKWIIVLALLGAGVAKLLENLGLDGAVL